MIDHEVEIKPLVSAGAGEDSEGGEVVCTCGYSYRCETKVMAEAVAWRHATLFNT